MKSETLKIRFFWKKKTSKKSRAETMKVIAKAFPDSLDEGRSITLSMKPTMTIWFLTIFKQAFTGYQVVK